MELKVDNSKTYAIALEGGGAKGAYEIGVWKALQEAGIKYNAVSGTSVGSINGALMTMGDLDHAIALWESIKMSKVIDVNDADMESIMKMDISLDNVHGLAKQVVDIIKNRGLDITPLRNWLREAVDVKAIKESPVEFFLTTVSLSDKKELEIRVRDLEDDEVCDMLIASSYLPAFRMEPLGGKYYADGGFQDAVPIHVLVENGYRDIIEVRMGGGFGVERRFKLPEDVNITTIESTADLGSILNFVSEQSKKDLKIGYCDGMKVLYGLCGNTYYIDRTLTERQALDYLIDAEIAQEDGSTLREICEKEIPALARYVGAKNGGYYDIFLAALEKEAAGLNIDPYRIMTDVELMDAINDAKKEQIPGDTVKSI